MGGQRLPVRGAGGEVAGQAVSQSHSAQGQAQQAVDGPGAAGQPHTGEGALSGGACVWGAVRVTREADTLYRVGAQ